MIEWMTTHPIAVSGLVLWCIGVLWLMPGRRSTSARTPRTGMLVTAAGVIAFCFACGRPQSAFAEEVMFWLFGVGALLCGVLMITARNPVYGALWFALATLSTCGLFLLQQAPFLAAATVIVYAGAVIVTFLFVIMLAQQSGAAGYDQRSGQSWLATISAFVLLGSLSLTLLSEKIDIVRPVVHEVAVAQAKENAGPATRGAGAAMTIDLEPTESIPVKPGNLLSKADDHHPVGNLKGLGRSLFGDYLFAVELAGTLLLIASIGAIAIAPRREQGAL